MKLGRRGVRVGLVATMVFGSASLGRAGQDWPMYNGDATGSRASSDPEAPIKAWLEDGLEIKWRFDTPGAVFATPVVVDGVVYAGDTEGNFFAVDAADGTEVWHREDLVQISSSALVVGNRVIVGTIGDNSIPTARTSEDAGKIYGLYRTAEGDHAAGDIAYVITGAQLGVTERGGEESHPQLSFVGSPMLAAGGATDGGDVVVIGLASYEEEATADDMYECCSFRGGVAAFDPETGEIAWTQHFISDAEWEAGSSGAPVWSTPTYDRSRRRIYVSTGNNYSEPATLTSDAIVALRVTDGAVQWSTQLTANDTWNYQFPISEETPDSDFGDSVNVFRLADGRPVVAAGQKSGFFHMLDALTGEIVEQRQVVDFGILGGLFADSGFADGLQFVNGTSEFCSDLDTCGPGIHDGLPNKGIIQAIDPDDALAPVWTFETTTPASTFMSGVAIANGIVYAQQSDVFDAGNNILWALDARTGAVVTSIDVGSSRVDLQACKLEYSIVSPK